MALRLGLGLCAAHLPVWLTGTRGLSFVCKTLPSLITRNHTLNDIISYTFAFAKIPATKEPYGLFRSDGKRPDGLNLIPWQRGCPSRSGGGNSRYHVGRLNKFQLLHPQLAPQLRRRRPENKPSTPHCQGRTCSSRLLWKLWAQSANLLSSS